ncbi:hypothetical protein [Flavobacterium sp. WC2429]|uniref:Uncharacterized protein n=2 Tax=unclassified Flavobacterium TaxID=196869 RepID=A0AB39WNX2_9FLAO
MKSMLKKHILLFLFYPLITIGQVIPSTDTTIYKSRKGIFEIKYNNNHWIKSDLTSKWDAEFHDTYNLLNAYFIEYDYFVPEKNIKKTLKSQYAEFGKIKNLKIYDKMIHDMKVKYFTCTLDFNNYTYIFQGFLYNGKAGTMQIQFGAQQEAIKQYQVYIDEFCSGITQIKGMKINNNNNNNL